MRRRSLLILTIALVGAACAVPESTSTPPPGVTAQKLAYAYQPGQELSYRMNLDMGAEMHFTSNADGDQEMTVGMGMVATSAYLIAEGPEPGTSAITVRVTLDDLSLSDFSLNGEQVRDEAALDHLTDSVDINQFIPEVTVVVDELGNVVSADVAGTQLPTDFLNGLVGDPTGSSIGALFGAGLPEGGVFVGAVWSEERTVDVPFFGEWTVHTEYEVVREETFAGHDVFVIESTASMPALSLDFDDMIEAFEEIDPAAAAAMGATPDDLALSAGQFRSMRAGGASFEMTFRFERMKATTWFDPTAGLARRITSDALIRMTSSFSGGGDKGSLDAAITTSTDSVLVSGAAA